MSDAVLMSIETDLVLELARGWAGACEDRCAIAVLIGVNDVNCLTQSLRLDAARLHCKTHIPIAAAKF